MVPFRLSDCTFSTKCIWVGNRTDFPTADGHSMATLCTVYPIAANGIDLG